MQNLKQCPAAQGKLLKGGGGFGESMLVDCVDCPTAAPCPMPCLSCTALLHSLLLLLAFVCFVQVPSVS